MHIIHHEGTSINLDFFKEIRKFCPTVILLAAHGKAVNIRVTLQCTRKTHSDVLNIKYTFLKR